jgi:hypothetical protein
MSDPVTGAIMIGATAVKGISDAIAARKEKKRAKMRAKEMERETKADLLNEQEQREAELESHRLSKSAEDAKRKSKSSKDTADIVRGALRI